MPHRRDGLGGLRLALFEWFAGLSADGGQFLRAPELQLDEVGLGYRSATIRLFGSVVELDQHRPFLHRLAGVEVDGGHTARHVGGQQHLAHGSQITDGLQHIGHAAKVGTYRLDRHRRRGVVFNDTAAGGAPDIQQAEDPDEVN